MGDVLKSIGCKMPSKEIFKKFGIDKNMHYFINEQQAKIDKDSNAIKLNTIYKKINMSKFQHI